MFSNVQVSRANAARKLQQDLGWPGTSQFKNLIKNNHIMNFNVSTEDVDRSIQIYGIPTPML